MAILATVPMVKVMNIVERLFLRKILSKYKFTIQENIRIKSGSDKKTITYYISLDNIHLDKRIADRLNINYSTYRKLLLSIKGAKLMEENVEFESAEAAKTAIKSILGVLYIIARHHGVDNKDDNKTEWDDFIDKWENKLFGDDGNEIEKNIRDD